MQGELEIQYLLILAVRRDLLDKLQKLLALSIEKVEETAKKQMAKDKEIAADNEMIDDR